MGKNETALTLKIPKEMHHKLKMIAAASDKSMTDVIVGFIEKAEIKMPSFMQAEKKSIPKGKKSKPVKPVIKRKRKPASSEELKKTILGYKAQGLGLQAISDKLEADGIPTSSGRGA